MCVFRCFTFCYVTFDYQGRCRWCESLGFKWVSRGLLVSIAGSNTGKIRRRFSYKHVLSPFQLSFELIPRITCMACSNDNSFVCLHRQTEITSYIQSTLDVIDFFSQSNLDIPLCSGHGNFGGIYPGWGYLGTQMFYTFTRQQKFLIEICPGWTA